jgi:arylsulfatase A-like enzyme
MHSPVPLTDFALAMIANLALVSLAVALLWIWLERTRAAKWIRFCLPALYFYCAGECFYLYRTGDPSAKGLLGSAGLTLCLTWVLYRLWPQTRRPVEFVCGKALGGLGIFCLLVVAQLLHLATWRPVPNFIEDKSLADAVSPESRPRVVWILMDELSYNQVFAQRTAGLDLPNFDKFRQSATVFTNVTPATDNTQTAIPSLLLGRLVDRVGYTWDNHYLLATQGQSLHAFPVSETPFAVAKSQGLTTGVVGWYNPYCSMLAPYLDDCYWNYQAHMPAVFVIGDRFWRNFADAWLRYWIAVNHGQRERSLVYQAKVYENLTGRANRLLAQNQPDFVFLHLPVPHPPGFYNRRTGQFETINRASYLDNLALADKTLGELLATLHASPRWANTSIVLCGDHSWRTHMWRGTRHWTREDEMASHGGVFDPRPMLMVHQAGETTPATIDRSIPLIRIHDILDNLIRGEQPDFQ